MQKPDIRDAAYCKGSACFHLALVRHRFCLLHSNRISAGVASGAENYGNSLAFVQSSPGDVIQHTRVVVRMCNHQQDVGLISIIRGWKRWCVLLLTPQSRLRQYGKQCKDKQPGSCASFHHLSLMFVGLYYSSDAT